MSSEIKAGDLVQIIKNLGEPIGDEHLGKIGIISYAGLCETYGFPKRYYNGYILENIKDAFFIKGELKKIKPLTDDEINNSLESFRADKEIVDRLAAFRNHVHLTSDGKTTQPPQHWNCRCNINCGNHQ